ncbi:alpha-glucan family phosphorylase [Ramlibacter ginsenosidimutans]|uniref:glycogen phosphorylase n=1 Tax=Ramlibacter ginsenosidimutans TaxID=502333 RepID=A0A934WPX9_9BURK|nr:alpha-glucan family phosphorylase [Ramlibacter ginsenosidimutans]MBK6008883.1 alpha-glucan family phosphorylase [Ramlibacter ginsenosidimutans]
METPNLSRPRIAYFSMEIALEDGIPTYSGGLGVLAGDLLRSASDLGVPMVGVTLASRQGYFRQEIDGGEQVERPQPWDPAAKARRLPCKVSIRIAGREVWVGAWQYDVQTLCRQFQPVPVILLDTDLPENGPADRRLTDWLYGGDDSYRLEQEIVLGIGGLRMLDALGMHIVKFHLNEGHSAFLTLDLLREQAAAAGVSGLHEAIAAVRRRCVFTTHTPVEAGHDQFPHAVVEEMTSGMVDQEVLRTVCPDARFNMTRLALSLSGWVNGVADRHAQTSRSLFPGYEVHAITNGVHALTWTAPAMQAVFDRHIPQWCHEPELLVRALRIPDAEVTAAHARAKQDLMLSLAGVEGAQRLDPQRFTIGFARRMTDYKRPGLLFTDLARLRAIADRFPFQVIVGGKAHPRDEDGKRHIASLHAWARELAGQVTVVFVPDYAMAAARRMVAGVDLWLNTPLPPMEASGTSGMKAALNGVPSLSVLDGWWIEGCDEGVTGWAIGEDGEREAPHHAEALYDKLERVVLPKFRQDHGAWAAIMKSAIARNGSYFNSHRMLRRYVSEAYWN